MKTRSNYDFRTVEECKQDAKEMVNLLKMKRTCGNAKERASRLNDEVYNRNCGYIKGSKVKYNELDYVEYMLLSGHAFQRASERGIDESKLEKLAFAVVNNFDAFCEIDNHCVLPVRDSRGRTIDGTGENGKTATVVQVEGSNILLITERYANGIRIASCWNTQKRRYGLQEHDDYIFVRKDGSVTHKLSRDVFVFPKTKRA